MADWNQKIIDEFRANGGTVQTMGFGRSLVLLHHVGARTGAERVTPLAAVRPADGEWFLAASKGGAPTNPAWFHNLVAHPDVSIEDPDEGAVAVRADVLQGDERDSAWARFEAMSDGFAQYQRGTDRVIPVVRLRRAS